MHKRSQETKACTQPPLKLRHYDGIQMCVLSHCYNTEVQNEVTITDVNHYSKKAITCKE